MNNNHVEALLLESIKRDIETVLSSYVYEPNDTITRNSVCSEIEGCLQTYALDDYTVVCDESNNQPETVDRGLLRVEVAVLFINSANGFYYIPIEMRGEDFEEQININVSFVE